jgi:hypothetical protein
MYLNIFLLWIIFFSSVFSCVDFAESAGTGMVEAKQPLTRYPLYDSEDFFAYIKEDGIVCFSPKKPEDSHVIVEKLNFSLSLYEPVSGIRELERQIYFNIMRLSIEDISKNGYITEINIRYIYTFLLVLGNCETLTPDANDLWTFLIDRFCLPYILKNSGCKLVFIDLNHSWLLINDKLLKLIGISSNMNGDIKPKLSALKVEISEINKEIDKYDKKNTRDSTVSLGIIESSDQIYIQFLRKYDTLRQKAQSVISDAEQQIKNFITDLHREFGVTLNQEEMIQLPGESELLYFIVYQMLCPDLHRFLGELCDNYLVNFFDAYFKHIKERFVLYLENPKTKNQVVIFFNSEIRLVSKELNCSVRTLSEEFKQADLKRKAVILAQICLKVNEVERLVEFYLGQLEVMVHTDRRKKDGNTPQRLPAKKDSATMRGEMEEALKDLLTEDPRGTAKPQKRRTDVSQANEFSDHQLLGGNLQPENPNRRVPRLNAGTAALVKACQPHTPEPQKALLCRSKRQVERSVLRVEKALEKTREGHRPLLGKDGDDKKQLSSVFKDNNYLELAFQKMRTLDNAVSLTSDFFQRSKNPKYEEIKEELMSCNILAFKHPRCNKELFCWKVAGRLYTCWVDIPHASQLKMADGAGWYLRLKEKMQSSGAIAEG